MNTQAVSVRTAPRSPWQNAYAERVIGSIRRECLDHVIVMNAGGLHRVLTEYVAYYNRAREHISRLARTRRAGARSYRHQPVALSPFQKSAGCTTATIASPRSRRPTSIPAPIDRPPVRSTHLCCAEFPRMSAISRAPSGVRRGLPCGVAAFQISAAFSFRLFSRP
jgi:hypothetical protein